MQISQIKILGKKIKLRDWNFSDLDAFKKWQLPHQLWQRLDGPYYRSSIDNSEELTQKLKSSIEKKIFPNPRMQLAICDLSSDHLIGIVSSYWESKETNWLCIGIIIYDPSHWEKGIGFEAMSLWIEYLFKSYPEIVRLDMRTWSGNLGLIHLAKKLNFSQEACFRQARIVDEKYYDGLGFGILRSEFLQAPIKNDSQ